MKNKSILATLLSMALAINCIVPAFATEVDDPVKMDTPVNVTAEAMEFSVMVPTSLPVNVAADGAISVADNAAIENNSYGPVKITNVVVSPATGWALMDFDTDVSTIPMNSKKIGLKLQNNKVNTDGTVSLQGFGTINGGIGLELSYDAIVGGFSTDTNVSAASVTITIGWDEATITGYDVKPPKVDASDLNPEDYGVDYIVSVGSQFYMTGTATYALEGEENPFDGITWTSSDESVATVDTDGLVTVLAAGYFDISGEIPGIDEPVTVKYGVPDNESGDIPEPIIPYLTFEEQNGNNFTFQMSDKKWDGTIEYSIDGNNWTEYSNASTIVNSVNGKLYLRGSNNTHIADNNYGGYSIIKLLPNTSKIKCVGNIETLLDYQTVTNGEHPHMERACFSYLFYNCIALVKAPEILATKLSNQCYSDMFEGCTSLIQAPSILPAETATSDCYRSMFYGCNSLINVPKINLITSDVACCQQMFEGCSSLNELPILKFVNSLPVNCCYQMFYNCSKVKLSDTQTDEYTIPYKMPTCDMTVSSSVQRMFTTTGGTFKGTPTAGTTYYLHNSCSIVE